jgi:hypothetical protein
LYASLQVLHALYHKECLLGKHNSVPWQVADRRSVINQLPPDKILGG